MSAPPFLRFYKNDIFYVIPKSKELSLKITDIFSRQDIMALKFGGNISEVGSALVDARHMPRNYTLKSDGIPRIGETIEYNETWEVFDVIHRYIEKTKHMNTIVRVK